MAIQHINIFIIFSSIMLIYFCLNILHLSVKNTKHLLRINQFKIKFFREIRIAEFIYYKTKESSIHGQLKHI